MFSKKNEIKRLNFLSILFYFLIPIFSIGPFVKLFKNSGFKKGLLVNLFYFLTFDFILKVLIFLFSLKDLEILLIQVFFDFIFYLVFVVLIGIFVFNIIENKKFGNLLKILLISIFPLVFLILIFFIKDNFLNEIILSNFYKIFDLQDSLKLNKNFILEITENLKFLINYVYPKIILPFSLITGYLIYQNVLFYNFYENKVTISNINLNNFFSWLFLVFLYIFIFIVFIIKQKYIILENIVYNLFFGFTILFFFQGLGVIFYRLENSKYDLKFIKNIKVLFFCIYVLLIISSIYLFIILFFLISCLGILENVFKWRNKLITTGGDK
ncbi:MAG: hypothetical protein N3A58_02415 [Spirochaetes bacterium]|nr:hypothetical protein [Spirochaetota bacterium]